MGMVTFSVVLIFGMRLYAENPIDFMEGTLKPKIIDRSVENLLYDKVFRGGGHSSNPFESSSYRFKPNTTSSSWTTQYRDLKSHEISGRDFAKILWKSALTEVKRDLLNAIRDYESESNSSARGFRGARPSLFSITAIPKNKFRPNLKFGTNFVKPELTLENALNTKVTVGASYHSRNEVLETKLLKPIGPQLEFSVKQISHFTHTRPLNNEFMVGLDYQF